jgi:spermidine/putrescine transport system ATP-binding protein
MTLGAAAPLPEIRLVDLTKQFGEVRAVDRVALDIVAGEFFSLLGPSGCGKTTTLRMVGGFELPTAGRIELRGRDVTNDPPDKRPVNMVFQNYALFPHLDVGENVAFGLRRHKVGREEIARRVTEALELVRLSGYEKRRPNQLSGGQQQRVALARALVNRPTVLLLDEPLGALDLKLRRQLQVELKRIQTEVGITFVYVTHDQEEALTMSDRIAVMNAGRVEQLGTPEELYERPLTRFVADFIGTTNLLAGTVESIAAGCATLRLDSGDTCRIPSNGLGVGRHVELSVRPEAVGVEPVAPAAASHPADPDADADAATGALVAQIDQIAYLGTAVQYRVRTARGLTITALASKAGARHPVGTEVAVSWSLDEALVLAAPPETGEERA